MSKKKAMVAIYATHTEAESAVKELQKAGFDMKKLSIVGKDYHSEEHVVGYYNTGDRMKYWGKLGAFLGRDLGTAAGSRLLCDSRCRTGAGGGTIGDVDRRSSGRRDRGGWPERCSAPDSTASASRKTACSSMKPQSRETSSLSSPTAPPMKSPVPRKSFVPPILLRLPPMNSRTREPVGATS